MDSIRYLERGELKDCRMTKDRSHVFPFSNTELPFPAYDLFVAVVTVALFIPVVILLHRVVLGPLMNLKGNYKGRKKET